MILQILIALTAITFGYEMFTSPDLSTTTPNATFVMAGVTFVAYLVNDFIFSRFNFK